MHSLSLQDRYRVHGSASILPYKQYVEARRSFGPEGQKEYNDWVWNHFIRRKSVDSKFKSFEMSTDGISTSLLYSREVTKIGKHAKVTQRKDPDHSVLPRTHVGVDPGKKNLVTMTDLKGISLRYTCRQRE